MDSRPCVHPLCVCVYGCVRICSVLFRSSCYAEGCVLTCGGLTLFLFDPPLLLSTTFPHTAFGYVCAWMIKQEWDQYNTKAIFCPTLHSFAGPLFISDDNCHR